MARPATGRALWLGRLGYGEALALQRELHARRVAGEAPDTLLLVEHTPVYTIGSSGRASSFRESPDALRAGGAMVVAVDRGGDVTWHGPGQLVGYPIFDIARRHRDLHRLLREVEQALIDACATLGVAAERREGGGATGVFVAGEKVASIGMRVSRWVSMHGFALNVSPDLSAFDPIVPCGLHGVRMTSLAAILGRELRIEDVLPRVVAAMEEVFDVTLPLEQVQGGGSAASRPAGASTGAGARADGETRRAAESLAIAPAGSLDADRVRPSPRAAVLES